MIHKLQDLKVQVIIGVILSVLFGYLSIHTSITSIFAIIVAAACVLFMYQKFLKRFGTITVLTIKAWLISSFLGAAFFSIGVGPFSLFAYRLLAIVVFLFFFIQLFKRNTDILKWGQIRVKPFIGYLMGWLCYAFLSLVWVNSFSLGVKGFIFLFLGILPIFVVVFYFKTLADYIDFFYIWLGMTAFLVAIGVWEHITGNHLSTSRIVNSPVWDQDIPTAVFFNQNDYATFLTLSLFFIIAFIKHIRNVHFKIYGTLLLVVSLYLIYVTDSRANFLAIAFGVVCWFFFLTNYKERRWILTGGGLLALLGVVVYHSKVLSLIDKLTNMFSFFGGEVATGKSIDIRINLIKNSLLFLVDTFGLGVGSNNAKYYIDHYSIFPTYTVLDIHNWWVEIAVNYGIFVFIGYLVLYLSLLISLYRIYKSTDNGKEKMICEALLGGMFVFIFASISPSSILTLHYQWIFFAFTIGFLNYFRMNGYGRIR
ncbi:O-antigen ligase family protein [Tuberibacillus sp. Marseille-P3662]|uniref:O-antigen ligase family protein n=1 Tax=Tuberibacillus sp. Marseille-P3662 TaxID=1965358 RepID=UPI000A1C7ACF|nr:O-antigen ligase family protein [Tuberibacillus sp. Marseille-P3662]